MTIFCPLSFSGGIDVQFGLSDYIQSMALPSWVWSNGLDFPRLYSWDQKARDELLELLKYDKSVQQRGLLNLELPDFQNLSFPNLCDSKKFEHYLFASGGFTLLYLAVHKKQSKIVTRSSG